MPYLADGVHPYDDWGHDLFSGAYDRESHLSAVMEGVYNHRFREIGPTFEDLYVKINGKWRRRSDPSIKESLEWATDQIAVISIKDRITGLGSPNRNGRQMVGIKGYNDVFHYDKETNTFYIPWTNQKINPIDIMTGELDWFTFSSYSEFEFYKSDPIGWWNKEHMYDIPYDPPLINVYPEFDLILGLRAIVNIAQRGTTLYKFRNGKNFRVDLDNRNWLHYHRRVVGPNGKTIPGQGIGRHRPWQTSSFDASFWDRF